MTTPSTDGAQTPHDPRDDYLIERDGKRPGLPFSVRVIRALQGLTIIVLAAASFGLFWVAGTMLGVF